MTYFKTVSKRAFSVLLAILFVVCGIPFSVSADGSEARIDDVYYNTLAEAINSASNGAVVTVVKDVDLAYCIEINKNIILNCEGTCTVRAASSCIAMSVPMGGTLTLSGSISLVGAQGKETVYVNGGTFNLRSGASVKSNQGAVNAVSGTVNLMGGSVTGEGASLVSVGKDAELRLSGDISFGSANSVFLSSGAYIEIPASLTGSGNIFVISENSENDTPVVKIDDGVEISTEQSSRFVSFYDGYSLYRSENCIYISVRESGSAKVKYNGGDYATVEDAVAQVPYGASGTITVADDISVTKPIVISDRSITLVSEGNHTISRTSQVRSDYMFNISSGASLTLATYGGTLTVSGKGVIATMPAFGVFGTLNIGDNAVISGHNNDNPNIFYQGTVLCQNGAFVNMTAGSITQNTNIDGTVMVYGGVFAMSGGSITSNKTQYGGGVYVSSGKFNFSGGEISSNVATAGGGSVYNNGYFTLSGSATILSDASNRSDVYLANYSVVTLNPDWTPVQSSSGSTIININPQISERNTVVVRMEWGTADKNTVDKFTLYGENAANNSLHANADFLFIGPLGAGDISFYVNGVGFTSLQDAFSSIPADGTPYTVSVTGDVTVESVATVGAGQNIILTDGLDPIDNKVYQSRKLIRGYGFDGAFITVSAGATLTLTSGDNTSLVFDGANLDTMSSVIYNLGNLIMQKNVSISRNRITKNAVYNEFGVPLSTGGAVFVGENATFTLNGGIISENYALIGGAVYVNNGSFTMNAGYISTNSAQNGGAIAVCDTLTEDNSVFSVTKDEEGNDVEYRACSASFVMTGGEITLNTASATENPEEISGYGGGVIIGGAACFTMYGGKIIENTAVFGNGVSVGSKAITNTAQEQTDTQNTEQNAVDFEEKIIIPQFKIADGCSFGENDDIYLTYYNRSYIEVIAELNGINKDAVLKITPCSTAAQNATLVKYSLQEKSETENESAARTALENEIFVLSDTVKELYDIVCAANDSSSLVMTVGETAFCYNVGKNYNPLPVYVEDTEEAVDTDNTDKETKTESDNTAVEEEKEDKKTRIKYSPFSLAQKGAYTVTYGLSYYSDMYTEVNSKITGTFPIDTVITMIDYSNESPKVYFYKVTGEEDSASDYDRLDYNKNVKDKDNEEVSDAFNATLLTDKKETPEYIDIPLCDFMLMDDLQEHYKTESSDAEKSSDAEQSNDAEKSDDKEKTTELKLHFTVDFSNTDTDSKKILIGSYEFMLSTNAVTEDNSVYNLQERFGSVEYTVTTRDAASADITYDNEGGITFSYSLTGAARIESTGHGVAIFTMKGGFPEGSAIVNGEKSYSASSKGNVIIVPLSEDDSGRTLLRDRMKLKIVNYIGNGIAGKDLSVALYASYDGFYPIADTDYDAVSNNVTVLLGAKDSYSVKISSADSRKPSYTPKDLEGATSVSFKIEAQCNGTEYGKVIFSLEQKNGDNYETVPLQTAFSGFGEAGNGAVVISPGAITLVFNQNIKTVKGTYRMVFTVGDKTEYIKLAF